MTPEHPNRGSCRYAAIEALHRLSRTRLPFGSVFSDIIAEQRLTPEDRQLARKICYGVLRNRGYLRLLLARLCRRPLEKISPFVYHALETGLFQLFLLDRIPPSAAVNETVKAVRRAGFPKQVTGFVNGVLRQSQRLRAQLPGPLEPVGEDGPPLNHPAWLTERWRRRYGDKLMRDICRNNNREPVLTLRLGPTTDKAAYLADLKELGIEAQPGAYAPESLVLPRYNGPVTALPGLLEGRVLVQDQAAQLAAPLLAPLVQNCRILDCCAGVGGKTTHLAALAHAAGGSLTALEPDSGRFRLLRENISRLADVKRPALCNVPLEGFAATAPGCFDAILVDAPCSGTGIIGRHPDIRWNRRERDLAILQRRQVELLTTAANLLGAGGTLVYATCSIEPEENEEVIELFLARNSSFGLTDCRPFLPVNARQLVRNGCFSPLPAARIDGFFAARLTKRSESD